MVTTIAFVLPKKQTKGRNVQHMTGPLNILNPTVVKKYVHLSVFFHWVNRKCLWVCSVMYSLS